MFSRNSSSSSLRSKTDKEKTVKLVKDPIHIDYIEIHSKFSSNKDLAYFVKISTEPDRLRLYVQGSPQKDYIAINSIQEFERLFEDIAKGWSRNATPEEQDFLKDKSKLFSSFLSVPEELTPSEKSSFDDDELIGSQQSSNSDDLVI